MKHAGNIKYLLSAIILIFALLGLVFYSNMMHLACIASLLLALITGGIFTLYLNGQYVRSLEQQENLRQQLTSDVAHELRTPLTAVSTQLEMMMDGVWEATPERLRICYDEIGRLAQLVSDLDQLAKSEGEAQKLEKSLEDLMEIAVAASKKFTADIEIQGEKTELLVDHLRIGQVISNLISNAIKYSRGPAKIRITVQNTPKHGIVTVEDNGIGIAENDLPYIFERFYRVEKSRNRGTGGTGLGLSIAQKIVESHHGSIQVESRLGEGSKFTVTLPK